MKPHKKTEQKNHSTRKQHLWSDPKKGRRLDSERGGWGQSKRRGSEKKDDGVWIPYLKC